MDIYLLRSSQFFSRQSNPRDIWAELQLRTTEIRIHSYLSTLSQAGQPLVKKYKSPPLLCNFPPTLLIAKQHFTDKWFVTFDTFDQSDEKIWPDQKIPNLFPVENTLKDRWRGFVTFETLITILTIDDLDSWQYFLFNNREGSKNRKNCECCPVSQLIVR